MFMARMGMDAEVVSGIGRQLTGQSQRLGSVLASVENLQRQAGGVWEGADLDRFQHEWAGGFRVQLKAAVDAIAAMGQSALTNAQEQLQASGGSGGAQTGAVGTAVAGDDQRRAWSPEVGRLKHARELLDLSSAAYHTAAPSGWSEVEDFDDPLTGFSATLYKAEDGRYVLAFEGTESDIRRPISFLQDWTNDVWGGLSATFQDDEATELAQRLRAKYGDSLEFTGHSLGGRLATEAAMATGGTATVFNSAGLAGIPKSIIEAFGGNSAKVDAYNVGGDILSYVQDEPGSVLPGVYGDRHELGDPEYKNPFDGHSTDSLGRALDEQIEQAELRAYTEQLRAQKQELNEATKRSMENLA